MVEEEAPDGISARHLRPASRLRTIESLPVWILGTILGLALIGVFGGGKAQTTHVSAPAADLSVRVPRILRSGMFFEMQIDVVARAEIADLTIALPPSLWHEMTINTVIPAAESEAFKGRDFRFSYGRLRRGERLSVKVDGQINPALTLGTRGDVRLFDGDAELAELPTTIRVLP